jgi:L-asparaginase
MSKKVVRKHQGAGAKILIIYTGGTIGMIQDPIHQTLKPFNFNKIITEIPELKKFNYEIDAISFKPVIDSSNMTPTHWERIADIINKNYSLYDGFVILHGTDTLAYTASALSYMLENLSKTVILTGSQLPVKEIRTDAPENLITAIEIAASKINNRSAVPEVCIYFDSFLFRGNRASKYDSAKFAAFHSPNYPPIGEAGVDLTFNEKFIRSKSVKKLKVISGFDENVGILTLFPGMSQNWLQANLQAKNLKAIILETYGSGNGPTAQWFLDEMAGAIKRGMIILNISQCPAGSVTQGKYATSKALRDIGVIGGLDMTREAAVTKLMFLLGQGKRLSTIKKQLKMNIRGELTPG